MARPFASLDKVIVALHAQPAQTVEDLHVSTGLSVVQVRRAIWRARDEKLVGEPTKRPGTGRAFYQYTLNAKGHDQVDQAREREAERAAGDTPVMVPAQADDSYCPAQALKAG